MPIFLPPNHRFVLAVPLAGADVEICVEPLPEPGARPVAGVFPVPWDMLEDTDERWLVSQLYELIARLRMAVRFHGIESGRVKTASKNLQAKVDKLAAHRVRERIRILRSNERILRP